MKTVRLISQNECPWLEFDIPKGTELFRYTNYTYGCIAPSGIAVTYHPDQTPFFEVPKDAVR